MKKLKTLIERVEEGRAQIAALEGLTVGPEGPYLARPLVAPSPAQQGWVRNA